MIVVAFPHCTLYEVLLKGLALLFQFLHHCHWHHGHGTHCQCIQFVFHWCCPIQRTLYSISLGNHNNRMHHQHYFSHDTFGDWNLISRKDNPSLNKLNYFVHNLVRSYGCMYPYVEDTIFKTCDWYMFLLDKFMQPLRKVMHMAWWVITWKLKSCD